MTETTFQDWMDGQARIHEQIMEGLREQLPILGRIAALARRGLPREEAVLLRKTAANIFQRRTWNHERA